MPGENLRLAPPRLRVDGERIAHARKRRVAAGEKVFMPSAPREIVNPSFGIMTRFFAPDCMRGGMWVEPSLGYAFYTLSSMGGAANGELLADLVEAVREIVDGLAGSPRVVGVDELGLAHPATTRATASRRPTARPRSTFTAGTFPT